MAKEPSAQDDARENRLVDIFNLERETDRARHGTDAVLAVDGSIIEFELKSVTRDKGSISTVRDFGPDHIAKWKNKHWIVGFFDGTKLTGCRYGSPHDMAPWVNKTWNYIKSDFEIAKIAPGLIDAEAMFKVVGKKTLYTLEDARRLQKAQYTAAEYKNKMDLTSGYSAEQMLSMFKDRVRYVIERGSTLNNPHIPFTFFNTWPEINTDHAAKLRKHIRAWLKLEQS